MSPARTPGLNGKPDGGAADGLDLREVAVGDAGDLDSRISRNLRDAQGGSRRRIVFEDPGVSLVEESVLVGIFQVDERLDDVGRVEPGGVEGLADLGDAVIDLLGERGVGPVIPLAGDVERLASHHARREQAGRRLAVARDEFLRGRLGVGGPSQSDGDQDKESKLGDFHGWIPGGLRRSAWPARWSSLTEGPDPGHRRRSTCLPGPIKAVNRSARPKNVCSTGSLAAILNRYGVSTAIITHDQPAKRSQPSMPKPSQFRSDETKPISGCRNEANFRLPERSQFQVAGTKPISGCRNEANFGLPERSQFRVAGTKPISRPGVFREDGVLQRDAGSPMLVSPRFPEGPTRPWEDMARHRSRQDNQGMAMLRGNVASAGSAVVFLVLVGSPSPPSRWRGVPLPDTSRPIPPPFDPLSRHDLAHDRVRPDLLEPIDRPARLAL